MDRSAENRDKNPALSGVRVVELSQFNAGASCTEALAWFGADVVRIESPDSESVRFGTTEKPGNDSYEFIVLNANKRSVTLDLASAQGKQNLRKLIANADVLVENLGPGVIERVGFGYEATREINPRIIFAQINGFASNSEYANYLCPDMVAQAVGGVLSGTGDMGGPPVRPGPTIGDTGAALHCVMGILAALCQRQTTGRGQKIEVAMQDAVINLSRNTYQGPLTRGKPLPRIGNTSRAAAAPYNLYRCKPGGLNDYVFISIAKSAHKHWEALLKVMGHEDLLNDPRFSSNDERMKRCDEVDAMVSAWCSKHTKIEAMEAIQQAGATAGAVLDTRELSEDPHLRERGMFATVTHPVHGPITVPGWPVKMSESQVGVRSAPLLGAHTEEVLSEWLVPRKRDMPELGESTPTLNSSRLKPVANQALFGLRVLDLTQYEAGPSCTETLAWLGADVVKIEPPERGEVGRYANTEKKGVDAYYFILLNANKRSLTCDLKSEHGKEILKKLIINADVMVENMAPGAIERLGFGYDVIRQLNPRIIFAQLKGFAADGPRANYLCFDTIAEATGGSISITGVKGDPPIRPGANLGDTGAGLHCATGILAAVFQRLLTGRGQRVQVAMQESVINFSRMAFASYLTSGKPPERNGNRNLYRCKGGGANDYCFIHTSGIDNEQWHRLLRAISKQELIDEPRFARVEERVKHVDETDALLSAWCAERTKIEAMETLQGAGLPAGAVFDTLELSADPQLRKSGMFATIEHPVRGAVTIPAWPVKMSDSHVPVRSAPLLGAHTEEVLSEWAGLSKKEI